MSGSQFLHLEAPPDAVDGLFSATPSPLIEDEYHPETIAGKILCILMKVTGLRLASESEPVVIDHFGHLSE